MLGNLICWVIALGMMLSDSMSREDLYIKTLLAMGFIFLGILSKAVDVYKDTHSIELDVEEDENGKLVLSKK
jgi:hypothetical protein